MKKQCIIIGLGKFGMTLVKELAESDIEVLANNVQDTDSTISTSESVIKSNSVKAFSKGKDKNNTEKLNIII